LGKVYIGPAKKKEILLTLQASKEGDASSLRDEAALEKSKQSHISEDDRSILG